MVGKLLEELSFGELSTALGNAGIKGFHSEALSLVRLTVHIVSIGEDPYSFRFDLGDQIGEIEEEVCYEEVVEDAVDTQSGSGPSELTDGLSATRCSSETVSYPQASCVAPSRPLISSSPFCSSSRLFSEVSWFTMHVVLVCVIKTFRIEDDDFVPFHREYGGTCEDELQFSCFSLSDRNQSCSFLFKTLIVFL